eukprot:5742632-Alexandrium_andersonii.AAC.1
MNDGAFGRAYALFGSGGRFRHNCLAASNGIEQRPHLLEVVLDGQRLRWARAPSWLRHRRRPKAT